MLNETIQQLPTLAAEQSAKDKTGLIDPADAARDSVRAQAAALKGPPLPSLPDKADGEDEKSAYAALLEGIKQVIALVGRYNEAVRLKVAAINEHEADLRAYISAYERETNPTSPPPPPVGTAGSLIGKPATPVSNPWANVYGELKTTLRAVETMVKKNAAEPFPNIRDVSQGTIGRINHAVTAAVQEGVGRQVAVYLITLEVLGRAFGTDWHVTETIRLFDQLRKNMVRETRTISGSKLVYWRMRHRFYDRYDGGANGGVNDDNDKENALGWGALGHMVYIMWSMRQQRPELRERVEWGLEACMLMERKWHLKTGGDWNFPRDRVQHPYNRGTNYYFQQAEIAEKDPALYEKIAADVRSGVTVRRDWVSADAAVRAAWCRAQVRESVANQDAEIYIYNNGDYGECLAWAYNVLMATKESSRSSTNTDGYQPTAYVWHMQAMFLQTGINGLGKFATIRYQRALANTQFALVQPAPLRYRRPGEDRWLDIFAWAHCAPIEKRWVDGRDYEGQARTVSFQTTYGTRRLSDRAWEKGEGHDRYFEESHWASDAGMSLMLGSSDLVEYSRQKWGTSERPTSKGKDIGWLAGYALRLGLKQKLFTWN